MRLKNGNNFLRFIQLMSRNTGHSNPGLHGSKTQGLTIHHTTQPLLPHFSISNTFSLYGNKRTQLNKKKIWMIYNPITQFATCNHVGIYSYICLSIHMYQACVTSYKLSQFYKNVRLLYFLRIKLSPLAFILPDCQEIFLSIEDPGLL